MTLPLWLLMTIVTADPPAINPKPVELFNGKDLSGWEIRYGGSYTVENGVLVIEGGNGWLRSNRVYDDFDLTVEWRADAKYQDPNVVADSGLFFRAPGEGMPWPKKRYQVNMKEGDEGNVAELAGDKAAAAAKLAHPPGEWNTYRVRAVGPTVELWVNGQHAWKSDAAADRMGYLGLQCEGYRYEFRKITLTELGFTPMFNGVDLTGWVATGNKDRWQVKGELLTGLGNGGWLHTEKVVRNAVLTLEFKVPAGGNSGVFLRSAPTGNPAFSGMEIQILDDDTTVFGKLKQTQLTGSLYGSYGPVTRAFTKAETWQHLLISCIEDRVIVWLNGQQIVDGPLTRPEFVNRVKAGFFGFQDYGGRPMEFRNVGWKILDGRELEPTRNVPAKPTEKPTLDPKAPAPKTENPPPAIKS